MAAQQQRQRLSRRGVGPVKRLGGCSRRNQSNNDKEDSSYCGGLHPCMGNNGKLTATSNMLVCLGIGVQLLIQESSPSRSPQGATRQGNFKSGCEQGVRGFLCELFGSPRDVKKNISIRAKPRRASTRLSARRVELD